MLDALVPAVRAVAVSREDVVQFLLLLLSTAVCIGSGLSSLVREVRRDERTRRALRAGGGEGEDGLHCAMMETLGLHPALLGGMRASGGEDAGGNTRIQGHDVKGEWSVWYCIRHCNTNEEAYEEAGRFWLARWGRVLTGVAGGKCPFARPGEGEVKPGMPLTLGAGDRHCPGRYVAWMMLLMEAAKRFFEAFDVEGDEGREVRMRYFPVLREERDEAVRVVMREGGKGR